MGDVAAMGVLRRSDLGPGVVWPRAPRGARRCLFGPPNPEKTRTFLESETKRLDGENKSRWNFDFVAGKPLDSGRFTWTPVTSEGDSKGEDETGKGELQTRITDFMRKRKLPSHPKEEPTSSEEEPRQKTRRRFST